MEGSIGGIIMNYSKVNGIHIVEVPVEDFKIVMNDSKKKTAAKDNYCNAGFFATYHEDNKPFTLPVAHLICDYDATSSATKKYCTERGNFDGDKFIFDSSTWSYMNPTSGKSISTLVVNNTEARIIDTITIASSLNYAISGVPIMRNGQDVKFTTYVKGQGWDASPLYATWHIFIGLKSRSAKTIYVMAMKTTTSNMVLTAEAYNKFKALGFYDVIKLDGGGSTYMKANGKAVVSTLENRRINTIILFGDQGKDIVVTKPNSGNPYQPPTVTLVKGNTYKEFNKWLQYQLNSLGYPLDVDGCFGNGTRGQVIAFQKRMGLTPDGKVGPATRAVLLSEA